MENLTKQQIDKIQVMQSIWLMLAFVLVFATICFCITLLTATKDAGGVFIRIAVAGTIIWVPAVALTSAVERIFITQESTVEGISMLFGVETLLTFLILIGIFGMFTLIIPFIGLAMSIIIQLIRWFYLKRTGRLFKTVI